MAYCLLVSILLDKKCTLINENVVWLYISMTNAFTMNELHCFKYFIYYYG